LNVPALVLKLLETEAELSIIFLLEYADTLKLQSLHGYFICHYNNNYREEDLCF
jgi:hypothetical protein